MLAKVVHFFFVFVCINNTLNNNKNCIVLLERRLLLTYDRMYHIHMYAWKIGLRLLSVLLIYQLKLHSGPILQQFLFSLFVAIYSRLLAYVCAVCVPTGAQPTNIRVSKQQYLYFSCYPSHFISIFTLLRKYEANSMINDPKLHGSFDITRKKPIQNKVNERNITLADSNGQKLFFYSSIFVYDKSTKDAHYDIYVPTLRGSCILLHRVMEIDVNSYFFFGKEEFSRMRSTSKFRFMKVFCCWYFLGVGRKSILSPHIHITYHGNLFWKRCQCDITNLKIFCYEHCRQPLSQEPSLHFAGKPLTSLLQQRQLTLFNCLDCFLCNDFSLCFFFRCCLYIYLFVKLTLNYGFVQSTVTLWVAFKYSLFFFH